MLKADGYSISTAQRKAVTREAETVEWQAEDAELSGFPHFMLKEIYEQPETVKNASRGRLEPGEGVRKLGGIAPVWDRLRARKGRSKMKKQQKKQAGFIVSAELVLIATILVIGMMLALFPDFVFHP